KDDPRIAAYGTSDELSAVLAVARAELNAERERFFDAENAERVDALLEFLLNKFFTLGGDLATRIPDRHPMMPVITEEDVKFLESVCDAYNAELPPLKDFILPGGSRTAATLHVARTVARRAERVVVALDAVEETGGLPARWLNRASDALFVLARYVNRQMGVDDVIWRRDLPAPELPQAPR